VVNKLGSRLEDHGFKSHPFLDGNGVKAMPGLIFARNPASKEPNETHHKNLFELKY